MKPMARSFPSPITVRRAMPGTGKEIRSFLDMCKAATLCPGACECHRNGDLSEIELRVGCPPATAP